MTTLAGTRILLPTPHGDLVRHTLSPRSPVHDFLGGPPTSRIAYAAAHVVADPHTQGPQVDWDATLAFRRHLWGLGFGVADAMDTAQRSGGLGWADAKQLIARSGAEARAISARLVCGAMTDQLDGRSTLSLDDIVNAYLEQAEWIRMAGGTPVLMASRHLAQAARNADDYWHIYDRVLTQLDEPVILHWLGRDFDPVMATYWGSPDLDTATDMVLRIIEQHTRVVAGIKVSLLDQAREVDLRRRLPPGVRMFTGDDFNYEQLILGDDHGHSDALLGVFDATAAPARAALAALDAGNRAEYSRLLAPTVPMARHLFTAPTSAYKTGVVFLAWLNGHQSHFQMIGGAQTLRSVPHLVQLFLLADRAGALADPPLAASRMKTLLSMAGIEN